MFAGPDVEHPCEMYGDNQGHLTPEGQVYVAQTLGTHYSINYGPRYQTPPSYNRAT